MVYSIKKEILVEIIVRLIVWTLFIITDKAEPFIREIKPEEKWLYSFHDKPSYVPSSQLWVLILIFPGAVLIIEMFVTKKTADVTNALLGLSLSYCLNAFLTAYFKMIVGRPRPCFLIKCFPNGSGTDYTKCTGDMHAAMDARKSFPSGHSSFSFVCMVFMSLYLARKMNIWSDPGRAWKLLICVVPILVAASIAISRTCDYHHHYQDVFAGSLLGTVIACISYKLYFPSSETNTDAQ